MAQHFFNEANAAVRIGDKEKKLPRVLLKIGVIRQVHHLAETAKHAREQISGRV
jgi:hypothetical protein